MTDAVLGIDLGTSSVKALVVDTDGNVRGTGSAEYPVLRPQPGWAEQDPDAWWKATVDAVQQAVGWSGASVTIGGVGFSGQMHGVVFLGENDRVLSPAVIWADQRSSDLVADEAAALAKGRDPSPDHWDGRHRSRRWLGDTAMRRALAQLVS
jgi:xylulokinase